MKITLSFSQFIDNWPDSRKDQFSYDALKAIFEWYEELEEGTNEEMEFDPIAICCEWSEYESALECIEDCGYSHKPEGETGEEKEADALQWLQDQTTVLEHSSGIVIVRF